MSARIPEQLQTARLRAERMRARDETEIAELMLDPRVAEWLWPFPNPQTEADIHAGMLRGLDRWERHGFGPWILRDRATGALVGRGGLQETTAGGDPAVEVAWAIVPERWGEGLATELAHAAIATAFDELLLSDVIALTMPHNRASRRVMDKAGFAYERDIEHAGLPHVLYRLPRPG